MSDNLVWQLVVVFSIIASGEALMCLSCDHVAKPRDCGHVVTCGTDATKCFTEGRIGSNMASYYVMGCRRSDSCHPFGIVGKKREESILAKRSEDVLNCSRCCDTDMCNMNMCDVAATKNLRCMKCTDVLHPQDCTEIEECSDNYSCYVNAGVNFVNYEVRMQMGCIGDLQCNALKHAFSNRCVQCCKNADFCNYNACDNTSATSTTSTSSTSSPTTPLSFNAKPTVSVVVSPISHSFAIECTVTGHPTPTVIWTFVGNSTTTSGLPAGIQRLDQNDKHDLYVPIYNPTVHNGRYVCIASNTAGIATGEIRVP